MYNDPQTHEQWREVAYSRFADAEALFAARRGVAALYFLGFAVECYAKALCVARRRVVPYSHDLVKILEQADVRRGDIPAPLRGFVDRRNVSLRYQAVWSDQVTVDAEFDAGKRLVIWCRRLLNRPERGRLRKGYGGGR